MTIKHQLTALRDLHSAVNLADRVQSLLLFSSAYTLWQALTQEIDKLPSHEKPKNATYVLQKLVSFISSFRLAVMPIEEDGKTPLDWLESANDYLMAAEASSKGA